MVRTIRRACRALGFDFVRIGAGNGTDPLADMRRLLPREPLTIFDVGANVGQTALRFRAWAPDATIHAFEPSPAVYERLAALPGVQAWNVGVGATSGRGALHENTNSELSSFLPIAHQRWGSPSGEREVDVVSLDDFCTEHGIETVDVLKVDVQGHELAVFQGAAGLLSEGRVRVIYTEVLCSDMYEGLARPSALLGFLDKMGYPLVGAYHLRYDGGRLHQLDALLAHRSLT